MNVPTNSISRFIAKAMHRVYGRSQLLVCGAAIITHLVTPGGMSADATLFLERALAIDERYASGAIHEVLITLDGMSPTMGGNAARARAHFERAVELGW